MSAEVAGNVGQNSQSWEVEKCDNIADEDDFAQLPDFSAITQKHKSMKLAWEDLTYSIKGKPILKGVSGSIKSGELWCIMGPSGAGKSSLMNVLAGRIKRGKDIQLGGQISANDAPINEAFRTQIAYVMQEDALFPTSTPREALQFSAKMRLPSSVSEEDRHQRVEGMLQCLGLLKCADTYCGSVLIRGVSGGEKKRTAIAAELICNPDLLFLDEPTSGLDSYSAYQVVRILKALSQANCGVFCTIHQPSSEVFNQFDKCFLIADGGLVYGGSVSSMKNYFFDVCGKKCLKNFNPADFVMTIMQTESNNEIKRLCEEWKSQAGRVTAEATEDMEGGRLESAGGDNEKRLISRQGSSSVNEMPDMVQPTRVGFCTQMSVLFWREMLNVVRDKQSLGARFGSTIFLSLLYGFIFKGVGSRSNPSDLQSHFGALLQVVINAQFAASQPVILSFPLERPVFLREYATGSYGITSYFWSKLVVELPLSLLTFVVSWVCAYWLMELNGNFFELILETWALALVASSTALLLGCCSSNVQVAVQLAPLVFIPQLLFAGFFIAIEQIPAPLRWIQYICGLKFVINLALITEFKDQLPSPTTNTTYSVVVRSLFDRNNVNENDWWVYALVLFGIFALFRLGALVALRARAKNFG